MTDQPQRKPIPSQTWSFSIADGWRPIDDPFQGDDRDYNDVLRDAGYGHRDFERGDGQVFQISEAVAESPLTRQWRFLVEVALTGEREHFVFVADLPSVLALTHQVGGLAASQEIERLREIVDQFTRKTFAATHGHELHGICQKCSPHEWKLHQKLRQQRRNSQQRGPSSKTQSEPKE